MSKKASEESLVSKVASDSPTSFIPTQHRDPALPSTPSKDQIKN